MVKLIALYKKPENVAEFEQKYFETHVPLVSQVPGLRRVEISRVTGAPRGEPELYLITEMYFDDRAAMDRSASIQSSSRRLVRSTPLRAKSIRKA